MYYYGARYYDPRISIFISVDPLAEQTMTPYQYVHNNPVNLIDPTGMSADGWGLKNGTWEYKDEITKENFKKLGYSDYMASGNIQAGDGSYDYSLNADGSASVDGNYLLTEIKTPAGTGIRPKNAFVNKPFGPEPGSGAITPIGGAFDITGAFGVLGEMIAGAFSELTGSSETGMALALVATKGKISSKLFLGDKTKSIGPAGDAGALVTKQIPINWTISSAKKGAGTRFIDPSNVGNNVRVMRGTPDSPFPNSQLPYTIRYINGSPVDGFKKNILNTTGKSQNKSPNLHVPVSNFKF